jgi:hypothetical protein
VVRVAWDGDTAVCFGDGPLADFADGEYVFVTVGTGSGTLEHEFAARLRDLEPDLVTDGLLLELVDHVSLGVTVEEVEESLARLRQRRLVALVA